MSSYILSANLILLQQKLFMFQLFQDKADIFFHLPQSLPSIFSDGTCILEASIAFIIVKRITGFFCSFYVDYMYFTSQKVSFSFYLSLSLQLSHFLCLLLSFPFYSPLAAIFFLQVSKQIVLHVMLCDGSSLIL